MSLAGAKQFDENLRKLMDSDAFKKASLASQLNMGYRMMNSKYGTGTPLPDAKKAE